ncbi:MAG: PqqD family protein [Actinomycetota bacterium]
MRTPRSVDVDLLPQIPENVAWVEVDGEGVLYDELRQRVHVLSPTATLVWSGIDGRTSLERIAMDLSESFGTDLEVVRSDVLELARDLLERGLITEASSPREPKLRPSQIPADRAKVDERAPRFLQEPPGG